MSLNVLEYSAQPSTMKNYPGQNSHQTEILKFCLYELIIGTFQKFVQIKSSFQGCCVFSEQDAPGNELLRDDKQCFMWKEEN